MTVAAVFRMFSCQSMSLIFVSLFVVFTYGLPVKISSGRTDIVNSTKIPSTNSLEIVISNGFFLLELKIIQTFISFFFCGIISNKIPT